MILLLLKVEATKKTSKSFCYTDPLMISNLWSREMLYVVMRSVATRKPNKMALVRPKLRRIDIANAKTMFLLMKITLHT